MIPRKQILVVEDNALNRYMLANILEEQYSVLEAENGQAALNILKQQKDNIALILLDVMMPVMDGYTFLDYIKEDPELSLIPVIVMTQRDSEADEVDALSHGATDFVPKPYRPLVIQHRIAGIIKLRETSAMVNQFKYDRLTGLYSKEFFYQRAQEILAQEPDGQFDIICSNIENFTLLNELFGIPAGNQLLHEMAVQCMEQVGDRGICGRINTDHFAVLCERRQKYSDRFFYKFLNRINSLAKSVNKVNVKWGIFEVTDRLASVEIMCDRALMAANSIKGQYNKCFAFYDDKLRQKLLREQEITDSMEAALQEGQFAVYLQPKYSVKDNCLAGSEALVRWNHPKLGFLSPGEFIPIFEKNGFITRLDIYIWDRVCSLLHDWRENGCDLLPVSVNVSRADIYQINLEEILLSITNRYGISPEQLHLEITESAYTENPEQIITTVDNLRKNGFIIEMDDFGSGYSSLNMLNQMKIDILKLDMKFIQSETSKPKGQGILRFIVDLARWMNLRVVAEGVETAEQLDRLRDMGCDYVQGYLFAKPMKSAEFENLLYSHTQKCCVGSLN